MFYFLMSGRNNQVKEGLMGVKRFICMIVTDNRRGSWCLRNCMLANRFYIFD
jgi:hypothetical protein